MGALFVLYGLGAPYDTVMRCRPTALATMRPTRTGRGVRDSATSTVPRTAAPTARCPSKPRTPSATGDDVAACDSIGNLPRHEDDGNRRDPWPQTPAELRRPDVQRHWALPSADTGSIASANADAATERGVMRSTMKGVPMYRWDALRAVLLGGCRLGLGCDHFLGLLTPIFLNQRQPKPTRHH